VSAGLDYPSIGPEHAWLASLGRTEYAWIDDEDALGGFEWLARREGILPALESAHAIAWTQRELPRQPDGTIMLVNLSGRGDKDVETVKRLLEARTAGAGGGA
jgi:tryptophan synthase beta chain